MRTAVADTSLEAYQSVKRSLQKKEIEVMDFFAQHPTLSATRETIAEMMGWKEAAICGRVNSLVAKKQLAEVEGGKTKSGCSAKLVSLPKVQGSLFQ